MSPPDPITPRGRIAMTEVVRIGLSRTGGRDLGDRHRGLTGIRALGVEGRNCYFVSAETQQVVVLAVSDLTQPNLLLLQQERKWQEAFPTGGVNRARFDWEEARRVLVEACQEVGIFDPRFLRGRGIWRTTDGRVIVHRGDYVYIDGKAYLPASVPTAEIYPGAAPFGELTGTPLPEGDGVRLLDALELARWKHPCFARLVAGWLVTAPLCAILTWRPHLWLTGPAKSGKSWLLERVITPMLGELAIKVEGGTTAAGIRQLLGPDARPCVFDEAEAHKASGLNRIEGIMDYARHMSSQYAGQVVKGSSRHASVSFAGVTQFLLASIGVPLTRSADVSRWTVVELLPRSVPSGEEIQAAEDVLRGLAGSFPRDLLASTLAHLDVLLANHETYAQALEEHTGVRRVGDQLGCLLAGARLLETYEPITMEEALGEVAGLPEAVLDAEATDSDEVRLFNTIFSYRVRGESRSGRRQVNRTLGQMVQIAMALEGSDEAQDSLSPAEAANVLLGYGMGVRPWPEDGSRALFMLNDHPAIRQILAGTDFEAGACRVLQRLPGVCSWGRSTVRLPGLQSAKGTRLSLKLFLHPRAPEPEPK